MTDSERRDDAATPRAVDELAREYESEGKPFARVTVVRREAPVSANVGDRAVVTPDGELVGWVGGAACAQSVAVKEAKAALSDGEPRLVGLAPDPDDVARPGLVSYPMTCHSGGTLELFVEPVTNAPKLAIVGDSPIAQTLARLASEVSYDVTRVADIDDVAAVRPTDAESVADGLGGPSWVVVASMGAYDELGVEAALRAGAAHVALVASDERRESVADVVARKLAIETESVVDALTTPAGLDIGARTPEEIAVGILAELVAVRRGVEGPVGIEVGDPSGIVVGMGTEASETDDGGDGSETHHEHEGHGDADADADTVVDPVCGMDVVVGEAAATVEYDGGTYHFCGQGCADAFADDPERYLDDLESEDAEGVHG